MVRAVNPCAQDTEGGALGDYRAAREAVEDVLARMVKQERLRAVSMKMYTADNQRQPLASGSDVLEKMFPALQKMGALRI